MLDKEARLSSGIGCHTNARQRLPASPVHTNQGVFNVRIPQ
jgi:hypothetical protein